MKRYNMLFLVYLMVLVVAGYAIADDGSQVPAFFSDIMGFLKPFVGNAFQYLGTVAASLTVLVAAIDGFAHSLSTLGDKVAWLEKFDATVDKYWALTRPYVAYFSMYNVQPAAPAPAPAPVTPPAAQ